MVRPFLDLRPGKPIFGTKRMLTNLEGPVGCSPQEVYTWELRRKYRPKISAVLYSTYLHCLHWDFSLVHSELILFRMNALFFCSLGTVIPLLRLRFSRGCYTLNIWLLCKYNWVFCLLDNLHLRKCIQTNGWPDFWSQCMASRCLVGYMCIPCVKTSPTKIFVLQMCFQLLHVIITHNIHGVSIWSLTKSCKHVMISLKYKAMNIG
jgi:hypothetical protein